MTLLEKIEDWKKYPNAFGSESQAAVLLGEISAALNEPISDSVASALKMLSIRGAMRVSPLLFSEMKSCVLDLEFLLSTM
jgi:hypothetical protein